MNSVHLTLERQTPMYDGAYADKCVEVEVLVGGRKIPMAGYTEDELDVGELFEFVLRDTTIILTSDSEGFRKVLRLHADRETGEFLAPETIYDESPDSVGAYLDGCRDEGADEGGHLCDVRDWDWRDAALRSGRRDK